MYTCNKPDVSCRLPVVLVGNKKDLHMDRVVTEEEGRRLADSWKAIFLEASAKQNEVTSKKVSSFLSFLLLFFKHLFLILFYFLILNNLLLFLSVLILITHNGM